MTRPPVLAARELTAPASTGGSAVLRDVSFEVGPGERVVLTGASGSGKSTLLRCLVLLERARGSVLLDGTAVGPARVGELRRRVGYVAQRPVGVAATVAENLAFPRSLGDGAMSEAAQGELLGRLGLAKLDRTRRFDSLSGGEQQRIALVRSLTVGPDVLLLDEPTASLDEDSVGWVLELLERWADERPERALVWVSHQRGRLRGLETRWVEMRDLLR